MEDVRKTLAAQASLLTELITHAAGPALRHRGLSFATFELLSAVKAAGKDISQSEIAKRLGITPPTLTEAARVAREKGLLEQGTGNPDRRKKILKLTPDGERIIRDILQVVNQAELAMVEGIDPESLNTTVETLQTANKNLAFTLSKIEE